MTLYYDPTDKKCKNKQGAIEEGEDLGLVLFADGEKCSVVFRTDDNRFFNFEGVKEDDKFSFTVKGLEKGLYFYSFYLDGRKIGRLSDGRAFWGGEEYRLTVTIKNYAYPTRFKGGIIYQIFPDRFFKAEGYGDSTGKRMRKWGEVPDYLPNEKGKITNDDFFGGNFKGIELKLDYLSSLGVTSIYLNPVVKAHSSHRYDTGDYMKFDELLGSDDDFKSLISEADKRGISFIFDGVFNHVGDDSVYFNKYGNYPSLGAYQSKDSEYYDWFDFTEFPDKYRCWWGIDILPAVNRGEKSFEELIVGEGGVLDRYFLMGVKGVRLDVVDELSDAFIKKINDKVKSYGQENVVIGEVWEDATDKIAYGERKKYFSDGELDSVMNYPLKDSIIKYVLDGNAREIYEVVKGQIEHFKPEILANLMNVLGTHDTPRILTYLGKRGNLKTERRDMANERLTGDEYKFAVKALKTASLLQYTLYGIPSVYYGDEIGMQGNKDPFNRYCFEPEKGDDEILKWYRFLGNLRKTLDCFSSGENVVGIFYKRGIFGFSRLGEKSTVTIVVNIGESENITLSEEVYEITRNVKTSKIALNSYEFAIFYKGEKDFVDGI